MLTVDLTQIQHHVTGIPVHVPVLTIASTKAQLSHENAACCTTTCPNCVPLTTVQLLSVSYQDVSIRTALLDH